MRCHDPPRLLQAVQFERRRQRFQLTPGCDVQFSNHLAVLGVRHVHAPLQAREQGLGVSEGFAEDGAEWARILPGAQRYGADYGLVDKRDPVV